VNMHHPSNLNHDNG